MVPAHNPETPQGPYCDLAIELTKKLGSDDVPHADFVKDMKEQLSTVALRNLNGAKGPIASA